MRELGIELFKKLFQSSEDARDLWGVVRSDLSDKRVEIATSVTGAASVPWELLWDDKIDPPLVLRARAFVRTHHQPTQCPKMPRGENDHIGILLVICRPAGAANVPFRSVASRLIKGLGQEGRG